MKTIYWTIAMMLVALVVQLGAESIKPATKVQTAPMTAQEKKNLDMVMTWWREVLYAGHLDLAPTKQAANYIQHNPNINSGRAAFGEFFGKIGRKPIDPIPAGMPKDRMPVVAGAKGGYVWLIFEQEAKDPRDASKTYHFNTFDVLRIENGKVQEHWDSAQKMAGTGTINTGISSKPPMQWNIGTLSAEEKKSLELAT